MNLADEAIVVTHFYPIIHTHKVINYSSAAYYKIKLIPIYNSPECHSIRLNFKMKK